MKLKLTILVVLFAISTAVYAQNSKQESITTCEVAAFVKDTSSGVNVRADAGLNYGIISTIPKNSRGTLVLINRSKGKWLRITAAISQKTKVFEGTGWVYAPLLAVKENRNDYKIFKSPDKNSERIDISLFDHTLPLYGCKGKWAKVRLPVTGTGVGDTLLLGWIPEGSYCGNPLVECDTAVFQNVSEKQTAANSQANLIGKYHNRQTLYDEQLAREGRDKLNWFLEIKKSGKAAILTGFQGKKKTEERRGVWTWNTSKKLLTVKFPEGNEGAEPEFTYIFALVKKDLKIVKALSYGVEGEGPGRIFKKL